MELARFSKSTASIRKMTEYEYKLVLIFDKCWSWLIFLHLCQQVYSSSNEYCMMYDKHETMKNFLVHWFLKNDLLMERNIWLKNSAKTMQGEIKNDDLQIIYHWNLVLDSIQLIRYIDHHLFRFSMIIQ